MDLTTDPSLLSSLSLPQDTKLSIRQHGGSSFSSTWRATVSPPSGQPRDYFLKTGAGGEAQTMFAGEHASLNAIADAVPGFCPRSHAHGELATAKGTFFLATDFLELGAHGGTGSGSGESLARKLARLHTTPAPVPEGFEGPMYGFPVPTCCGSTVQDNSWRSSWAEFYAENRLRGVLRAATERNGRDQELSGAVERVAGTVVPRLLGDGHLKGVRPVVVHGDLWSGNHGRGRIAGQGVEEVVFDPSCVYGHSEYELGIMRMFGGYGKEFWKEYGELVPKTEPVEEYEDRLALYEL
jgi:fructosamine-3-kinase